MEKYLLVALVTAVFATQGVYAVQYVFQADSYTLTEVPGLDQNYSDIVMISRTDEDANEITQERIITITTTCPSGVTATAGTNDYSSTGLTVTFPAGILNQAVPVRIEHDDLEEGPEFFCLTIDVNPGSEYFTKIIIPANDFCYEVTQDTSTNQFAIDDGNVQYVGPWIPDIYDTPGSDTVEFEITPSQNVDGDVSIFLATHAYPQPGTASFDFYQIILDDVDADNGGTGITAGDTTLYRDEGSVAGDRAPDANTFQKVLVADSGDGLLVADNTFRFWLRYEESSGTITMGLPNDRDTAIATFTDGSANAFDVKHILVSSGEATANEPVTYKVCMPASPKKITPEAAYAVDLDNAITTPIDGVGSRDQDFTSDTCFLTETADDPWVQLDLGQVYDVYTVLIWSVDADSTLGVDPTDINGAQVWVGSCPSNDITNNKFCFNIDTTNSDYPLEGDCQSSTYGRYVYIRKETASTATDQFSFCEIEVYGTAVPYGEETTVQFTQEEYEIYENAGTVQLEVYRTYPSNTATCTTAEYYTDNSVSPVSADSNDFVAIASNPLTASTRRVSWAHDDDSGNSVLQSIDVTINNDNPGLCESYETFNVYLENIVGGVPGDQSWARVKILDEDSVSYSLNQPTYTVDEGATYVDIEVLRSGVGVMQTGYAVLEFDDVTATSSDYDSSSIQVDFPVSTEADAERGSVEIEDDEIYEESESFTVTLGDLSPNDDCSTYGEFKTATVIIADNDSRFRYNVDGDTTIVITEGESAQIEISREGDVQEKDLEIVVGEVSADLGDDFTLSPSTNGDVSTVTFIANDNDVTFLIDTENDAVIEGSETFTLTLRDPLYPSGNRADPYTITVIITDTDADYYWKQNSYSVVESSGTVSVCLVRTADTVARTVYVTTNTVTATSGNDYTPLTSINFVTSQTEACAVVQIVSDTLLESNEAFTISINSGQNIGTSTGQSTTTVTIIDDDNSVGWSQPAYTFDEDSTNNVLLITKLGTSSVSVTVTITSGTATQFSDYNLNIGTSSTITIPTGSQSYALPVTIINDNDDEVNEVFTLTLSSASNGAIAQATVQVTIVDDDEPPEPPQEPGLPVGAIVGIVAGVLVGLIIIVIIVIVFCYLTGGVTRARPTVVAKPPQQLPLAQYPPGYAGNNILSPYGGPLLNGYGPTGFGNGGYDPYVGGNMYPLYGRGPGLYR